MAAQLLTEIVAIMVAALLLDHEFLFTPLILNFPVGLLCIVTLLLIRPDHDGLDSRPCHENERAKDTGKIVGSVQRSIGILSQLLRDRTILALLATVPVAKLANPVTELMLQYIPRKFDLSLASVSFPYPTRFQSSMLRLPPVFSLTP
jgi:hypothetical protein